MARNLTHTMNILNELLNNRGPSTVTDWCAYSDFIKDDVVPLLGYYCEYKSENPITGEKVRVVGQPAVDSYFADLARKFDQGVLKEDSEFQDLNRFRFLLDIDQQRKLDCIAADFCAKKLGGDVYDKAEDAALISLMPAILSAARKKKKAGSGGASSLNAIEDLMRH